MGDIGLELILEDLKNRMVFQWGCPGHGLLVADLAPFLDDIPVKGVESFDSPELIAVPVPGLLAM